MRAVLVFCEGNHDVAFVSRSLGAVANAQWLGQPISELPSPFGPRIDPTNPRRPIVKSFIAERINARVVDGLKLMDASHPPPPSFQALLHLPDGDPQRKKDTLIVLLRSGGDGAVTACIGLIGDLLTQLPLGVKVTEVAAAFLFDADELGVEGREAKFKKDLEAILPMAPLPKHGAWVQGYINGTAFPTGLFVFHGPHTDLGTLEEVIAPMVETEWPEKWAGAEDYLREHQDPADPVAKSSAEALKAQVCITGQFRFPGDPMTQVLSRDGLPARWFEEGVSQQLVQFLLSVPWN